MDVGGFGGDWLVTECIGPRNTYLTRRLEAQSDFTGQAQLLLSHLLGNLAVQVDGGLALERFFGLRSLTIEHSCTHAHKTGRFCFGVGFKGRSVAYPGRQIIHGEWGFTQVQVDGNWLVIFIRFVCMRVGGWRGSREENIR